MRPVNLSLTKETKHNKSGAQKDGGLLGLRLLGDILDGEALLADDSSHVLSRHDDAEVLLDCARSAEFSRGPGLRGTLTPRHSAAASRPGSLIGRSSVHVCNVGHLERVVVKLVSRQLLDGSGGGGERTFQKGGINHHNRGVRHVCVLLFRFLLCGVGHIHHRRLRISVHCEKRQRGKRRKMRAGAGETCSGSCGDPQRPALPVLQTHTGAFAHTHSQRLQIQHVEIVE